MRERKYCPPKSDYVGFESDEHFLNKITEWGLTKSAIESVWYKDKLGAERVTIIGYEEYGADNLFNAVVIEFSNGELDCINPAYLKEMQSSGFGKAPAVQNNESTSEDEPVAKSAAAKPKEKKASPKPKGTKKSAVPRKDLPTDKVHFTARIAGFAEKFNPFNEDQPDEIILLDEVKIIGDTEIEVGKAWCGYSKTLKKFELTEDTHIEFDGKIVIRKYEDSTYKINNPSKIKKS